MCPVVQGEIMDSSLAKLLLVNPIFKMYLLTFVGNTTEPGPDIAPQFGYQIWKRTNTSTLFPGVDILGAFIMQTSFLAFLTCVLALQSEDETEKDVTIEDLKLPNEKSFLP